MAYFHGSAYREVKGATERLLCDQCAKLPPPIGVPFVRMVTPQALSHVIDEEDNVMQARPWTWHPVWGANCHNCGKRC